MKAFPSSFDLTHNFINKQQRTVRKSKIFGINFSFRKGLTLVFLQVVMHKCFHWLLRTTLRLLLKVLTRKDYVISMMGVRTIKFTAQKPILFTMFYFEIGEAKE